MRFLEFPHPEGGRMMVHVDHITSAIFREGHGEIKTRLGLDLDQRQNDIVLFGEDAEHAWHELQRIKDET